MQVLLLFCIASSLVLKNFINFHTDVDQKLYKVKTHQICYLCCKMDDLSPLNNGYFYAYFSYFFLFNPFPNKPWFLHVFRIDLLKTLWEKEKLLVSSNFSFSRSVFYPFGELYALFIKFEIVVCILFQLGKV